METLIQSTDRSGNLQFVDSLEPGQKIRLVAGPFARSLGILDRLDDTGRVEVLLEIMGGGIRVKLSRNWVEPASPADEFEPRIGQERLAEFAAQEQQLSCLDLRIIVLPFLQEICGKPHGMVTKRPICGK